MIHHAPRTLALLGSLSLLASAPACSLKSATAPAPPAASAAGSAAQSPASAAAGPSSANSEQQTARWTELKPGQCLAAPPPTDPAVVIVDIVDCAKPHSAEVYLRVNIPVDAAVTGTANTQCETGLPQYTGTSSSSGQYTITYMIDSDQDRTSNNPLPSTLICLLQSPAGKPLTGSARV